MVLVKIPGPPEPLSTTRNESIEESREPEQNGECARERKGYTGFRNPSRRGGSFVTEEGRI